MQKFPWTQYLTTLLFYLLIAVAVYIIGSIMPKKVQPAITAEQAQNIEQQQKVEQTKLVYQKVLNAVGRLMVLPNALPQISVVNDADAFVRQNPVFAGTATGDIVLVYSNQIVVYSPKYDRVVHSVPFTQQQQPALPGTNTVDTTEPVPEAPVQ